MAINRLFLCFLVLTLMILPLTQSEQQSLGSFKLNECINLLQNCANCTYVNFTSVYFKGQKVLGNVQAEQSSSDYNYSFCNTTQEGVYIVNGIGDIDGKPTVFAYDLYITTNGRTTQPNNFFSISIVIFLMVLTGLSLWFAFKKNSDNKYINFVIKRSCLIVAIFLLMWSSVIIADIARQTGIDINGTMFTFSQAFGWGGYVAIVFMILDMVIRLLNQYKLDKKQKRFGNE